ncbi:hypothetical protein HELRODRAFT_84081 [Helobdella robusta]|uniref:2-iminobutanoate/2-iminopropanoate deaminase n=1 Tax=Helobdella robusta TaxID=6412 RepID=T1G5E4_HELRO|nr:hypothetical protein HELRODRAFT_84081 [Helobdella robusta]ESN99500.1 hypothetical protein HELRODRAFT_84081 [Helobdella robusta]
MAKNILKKIIFSAEAPKAVGPYSQAVAVNEHLFLSGQIGLDPVTTAIVPGGIENETEQVLKNMGAVLKAAGADYENIVKTTILLADINDFATVNKIYEKYFPSNPPARSCYAVQALPKGARVEIEAIAVLGKIQSSL